MVYLYPEKTRRERLRQFSKPSEENSESWFEKLERLGSAWREELEKTTPQQGQAPFRASSPPLKGIEKESNSPPPACEKREGQILGKPKGTVQKSKLDKDLEKIKELLGQGLSTRKAAKVLGYTNHIALFNYINTRCLRTKEV